MNKLKKNKIFDFPKSFLIRIIDNKNNTWQGVVSSPYWEKDMTFRSSLELIEIINKEIKKQNKKNNKRVSQSI